MDHSNRHKVLDCASRLALFEFALAGVRFQSARGLAHSKPLARGQLIPG